MKIVLSKTLSTKLRYLRGKITIKGESDPIPITYNGCAGYTQYIPGSNYISAIVDLSDHPDADYDIKQCTKWVNIIHTYFSTSYEAYRVNVGPFKGLYPIQIKENKIYFECESFDYCPSWKDWFIMEGDKTCEITISI
ncbi:MAG: hypothetical protein ACFFG0_01455 [Candidatus Thorarchaeota archaeon]